MKKSTLATYLLSGVIFFATMLETLLLQHYTTMLREWHSFWAWTPDYLSKTFSSSLPLSHFIANFLSQFCYYPVAGALILSAIVTLTFIFVNSCTKRIFSKDIPEIAAAVASINWILLAKNESFHVSVCILLCTIALWLVCLFIKRKNDIKFSLINSCIAIAFFLVACGYNMVSKEVKNNEILSRIEYDARMHRWSDLLKTATPERCTQDIQMLPYVTLALSESGLLPERIDQYPYSSSADMNLEEATTSRRYLCSSFAYECLGCTNEAIHNTFQFASDYPHGMNFLNIRRLIYLNIDANKPELVKKYCDILSKTVLHKGYVKKALAKMPPHFETEEINTSWKDMVITNNDAYNMRFMPTSRSACDRMLCAMLLDGNIDGFRALWANVGSMYEKVPSLYQSVLLFNQ